MKTKRLQEILAANAYPGRGIAVGLTRDGKKAVFAYFIMGRSANSRNRVFTPYGDEVRTEPFDMSKVEDPSLIIYSPVKVAGNDTIVTNGDQTDSIAHSLAAGNCFRHALMRRAFEPDAPHYTPRISAILHLGKREKDFTYEISILKCLGGKGASCARYFYNYEPVRGVGHFIHTYKKNASPLPSFAGEPIAVKIPSDVKTFAETVWSALDPENKISLVVRAINVKTGEFEQFLFNKYNK